MKKLLFALIMFCSTSAIFAADLVVEEFGVAPAYSSIQAAINAATSGDRILIKNRTGGIPWLESLSINKSIELLSFENDSTFIMQGDIDISPINGMTVTIVGLTNLTGNVNYTSTSGTARGTVVNIIDCQINGYINMDSNPYVLNLISSTVTDSYVHAMHGKIIGNHLDNTNLSVYDPSLTYTNEDFLIIGNKITHNSGNTVYLDMRSYNFQVKNNFIHSTASGNALSMYYLQTSALIHNIHNNTLKLGSTSSSYSCIYIYSSSSYPVSSTIEILNNVMEAPTGSSRGVYLPSSYVNSNINIYYNFIDGDLGTDILNVSNAALDMNNDKTSILTVNTDGTLPGGSPAIDGANPALPFYDLDLSVGDAGAYGGSFTLDNFFPLHTGSSRVYMVNYPFNVRQGSTLNINADSFDR